MKASMGLKTLEGSLTVGGLGLVTGWKAQCAARSLAGLNCCWGLRMGVLVEPGQGAPILTHWVRVAMEAGSSFFLGGMRRSVRL